jgi:uncharacterized protein (DUF934 family)
MRQILRRLEVVTDEWEGAPLTPLSELKAESLPVAPFGVALKPADKVEDLAPFLAKVSLVAIEFPNPGDGRGYTQAKLLRERYHFTGEIRAIGAGVKQDLLFYMARTGIDSFDLAPGEDFSRAQQALVKYNVAYQPGASHSSVQRQRFFR